MKPVQCARSAGLAAAHLLAALALLALVGGWAPAVASDGLLAGKVTSPDGAPMAGVVVSARGDGRTITISVFTDAAGKYYFPSMPAGHYAIWAQAIGYEPARRALELGVTRREDFALSARKDFERELSGADFLAALPDRTADDKRMKRLVRNNCTGCHTASFPLQHRFDVAGWTAVLDLMKTVNVGGIYLGPDHRPNAMIDGHEKELAAYLARARGPGAAMPAYRPRPRPTGEAARVVITEYAVPLDPALGLPNRYVTNDGSDWSQGTPSGLSGGYGVHDAWADLDGNLWFTYNMPSRDITIGRIDARTGVVATFKIDGLNGLAASSHGMTRDPQGIIWFNTSPTRTPGHGGLGRLDPRTRRIEVFEPPMAMSGTGGAVTVDYDGRGKIWASSAQGIMRFDPVTHRWSEFKSLTYQTPHGRGMTYGAAGDRDGNGWWAEMALDIGGRADVRSGRSQEVRLKPLAAQRALATPADARLYDAFDQLDFNTPFPWAEGPRRMGADKAGHVLWVGDSWGGNLARIDTRTLRVTYVPTPDPDTQLPYHAAVDSRHDVWTNLWATDQVLKYDPARGRWTVFELPTRGTEVRYVSLLERHGTLEVVLPYARARKVAVMTFRSAADLHARAAAQPR